MEQQFQIIEKPDWVSWDVIRDIVYKAHESNRNKGVDIRNAHLSSEQLKESLGADGVCFVALDGDKVVATSSVAFHSLNTWFARGQKAGYGTLFAVLPEYTGLHLFSKLEHMLLEYAQKKGCVGFYIKTAERNTKMRNIAKNKGYFEVSIGRTSFNPHNYVTIYKWLGRRPFSAGYIRLRFFISLLILKIKLITGVVK